jgi:hypothetical protein
MIKCTKRKDARMNAHEWRLPVTGTGGGIVL